MSSQNRFTRRQFLTHASALLAAPYFVPGRVLGADGATAASNRVTVACIGVRGMGNNHLKTLLGDDSAQVVAICDVDSQVRQKALDLVAAKYADKIKKGTFKGADGYNDFRELMARQDVEAVTIATPDHTHALIAIAALKSGKDVYVEKPMTLTIKEGRAMVEAVRRYGRVLQVGSQRRSSGGVRRVCEMVRSGRIGQLQKVEVGCGSRPTGPQLWSPEPVPKGFDYELWLGPAPWQPYTSKRCHYNFRFVADYSGGEMTNFGAHFLDVAQWGIGADDTGPVEIEGKGDA
ncbi:MAG: Gfo/Idh/MocA family oxidoreductase, partial [Planctomycetes bacterium]|nr:Gfo/Idh/MocA family oxidoreductase [Planctomycetota bacterium]